MTAAKCLYPEWCHIFVLAPHRNNWKIILRHCSPAQRGLCPAFGPAEQRRNSAWPSPPELFEDQLQDPTLNTFLGRKRNFSVHWPSAKKFFYADPSLWTVFDAAHKASLIPIRQESKLLQTSPAPSSLDLELSMVYTTRPILMFLLQTSDFLHGSCFGTVVSKSSHHKVFQLRTSGPSIHPL